MSIIDKFKDLLEAIKTNADTTRYDLDEMYSLTDRWCMLLCSMCYQEQMVLPDFNL